MFTEIKESNFIWKVAFLCNGQNLELAETNGHEGRHCWDFRKEGFYCHVHPRITTGVKCCRWPGVKVEFITIPELWSTAWLWLWMVDVWFCLFQFPESIKSVAGCYLWLLQPESSRGSEAEAGGGGRAGGMIFVFPCSCFSVLMQTQASKWHKCGPQISCAVSGSSENAQGAQDEHSRGLSTSELFAGWRRVLYQPLKFHFSSWGSLFDFYFLFSLPAPGSPSPSTAVALGKAAWSHIHRSSRHWEYKGAIELSGFFGGDCLSSRLKPASCSPLFLCSFLHTSGYLCFGSVAESLQLLSLVKRGKLLKSW